jgi:Associated with zinc fingers
MSDNEKSFITDTSVAEDDTSQPYERTRRRTKKRPKNSPPAMTRPNKIAAPGSPHNSTQPTFTTPNPFSVLPVDPDPQPQPTVNKASIEEVQKPPPIFIKNVANFTILCTALTELIGKDSFTCQAKLTQVIVRTTDPDSYRGVVRYLKAQNASFHTYQLSEERAFRVVIRGLHHTTPTDALHKELEENGFNVRAVTNALHPTTKTPLPLFFIDLVPNPKNKTIFDIKKLYFSKVKIEEPYKRVDVVQCQRCQNYGHTRSYCHHPARCVRCAGNHESATCIKTRDTPATCVLCGGTHPANYKGCSTYKDLQRLRRPANRPSRQQEGPRQPPVDLLQGPPLPQSTPGYPPHITPLNRLPTQPRGPIPQPRPRQRQQVPVATGPQVES